MRPALFLAAVLVTCLLSGCIVPCPDSTTCTYPVAEPYPAYYAPDYFGPSYIVEQQPVIIIVRPRHRLRRWP